MMHIYTWRQCKIVLNSFSDKASALLGMTVLQLEMHDEIFHFEIFKNFMDILKFHDPFFEIFHEVLIFIIKWLKTFKNKLVGNT